MNRKETIERVRSRSEPWDVVVVGGGATGAGCALDAASRGFSVLLLEQSDFGKGTSSRSTKLIHGGVRYLQQGNISLVREALAERKLLLDLAPDFVRPQPFIVPCYALSEKVLYGTGLRIYDTLARKDSLGKTEVLSADNTVEALPGIRAERLAGGVRYLDAQFDDARFLFAILEKAEELGAAVLNYAEVDGISGDGPVCVSFSDGESGESFEAEARSVINAAGIFADRVESLATGENPSRIAFSQGIHLVFDRDFLPGENALMIPKTTDGRVLFAIPWLGKLVVGTTDTPVMDAEIEPSAKESEIDFVLETIGGYLGSPPKRSDIRSVFAGIRPLVREARGKGTSRISREHLVESPVPGIVSVRGGKWTTFRRMAEDAVDLAAGVSGLPSVASRTRSIAIKDAARERAERIAKAEPEPAVSIGVSYKRADVTEAVRHGMAVKLEDVLARRTRLLFLDARKAIESADSAVRVMAAELGWDEERAGREVEEFRTLAMNYLPGGSIDQS